MDKETISQIMIKVKSLPPLPAAVERLCGLTGDLASDFREVAKIISLDEALTSRVLRVANSSHFGLPRRVSTISRAIVLMGYNGIRSLALAVTLFNDVGDIARRLPDRDRERFWRHSIAVATGARQLAVRQHLAAEHTEEVFVAGLLHDIGKLIFLEYFPEAYAEVQESLADGEGPALPAGEAEVRHGSCSGRARSLPAMEDPSLHCPGGRGASRGS